jgi:hypothetical protein
MDDMIKFLKFVILLNIAILTTTWSVTCLMFFKFFPIMEILQTKLN